MKTQLANVSNREIVKENIALRRFVTMLSRFFFGTFLLLSFSANAQELKLAKTIVGKFDYMTTDHIGRLYLAKRDELFLYSEEGNLMSKNLAFDFPNILHDCALSQPQRCSIGAVINVFP